VHATVLARLQYIQKYLAPDVLMAGCLLSILNMSFALNFVEKMSKCKIKLKKDHISNVHSKKEVFKFKIS